VGKLGLKPSAPATPRPTTFEKSHDPHQPIDPNTALALRSARRAVDESAAFGHGCSRSNTGFAATLNRRTRRFSRRTARAAFAPRAVCFLPTLADPYLSTRCPAFAFLAVSLLNDLKENLMKITTTHLKPRNPVVAHAQFRRAGSHRPSGRSTRQHACRMLQRELDRMKHSP
jgi:hypothetical protein